MFQRSRDETSYKIKMLGKFYACLKKIEKHPKQYYVWINIL